MKYENIYWDEYLLRDDHVTASILAIGDSWFWYPFPGGSLLNALSPLLETRQHTVLAVGKNGAEAYDYVNGTYKKLVDRLLTLHGGFHTSAINLLIDRYTDELKALAQKYAPRIEVVDTRETLSAGDWANELHPKPAGFRKIAERWRPQLRKHGLAT